MDAVYDTRWKTMYHAEVFIGLDPEFMVKAHLLIPKGEENLLYSWMLNFQYMSDEYVKMYKESKSVGDGKEPISISSPIPSGRALPARRMYATPSACAISTRTPTVPPSWVCAILVSTRRAP